MFFEAKSVALTSKSTEAHCQLRLKFRLHKIILAGGFDSAALEIINLIRLLVCTDYRKQCCGSGMIYSGSSFEFSEFRIRIQAKVPDPCGSGSTTLAENVVKIIKEIQKIVFCCCVCFIDYLGIPSVLRSRNYFFSASAPTFSIISTHGSSYSHILPLKTVI